MSKLEMHYLNCTDENCEVFCCVARRDYEKRIANSRSEVIKELREMQTGSRMEDRACSAAANILDRVK